MADTASSVPVAPSAGASPKKKDSGKATAASKKPRVKPSHPKTSDMVTAAIKNLKERGGSSLQAIKKYISSNYKVDAEKLAPFIKKYLKSAVTSGSLVQTKGKGASGSFKLSGGEKTSSSEKKPAKPAAAKQKKTAKTVKKTTAAAAKKTTTAAKKVTKPKAATTPKSPSKAKKSAKAPTKKPRAPKPKKATKPAGKSSPAKKAAASKKK